MKNIHLFLLLLCYGFQVTAALAQPAAFKDPRDGHSYRLLGLSLQMPDGQVIEQTWMAQNLNYAIEDGSWCYENDQKHCQVFGRLYTWEAAKRACPPGWRLPTDKEWRALARQFGGADSDAGDQGSAAFQALLKGGPSGFNALLGGNPSPAGQFYDLEGFGFYWTSSQDDPEIDPWYYLFSGKDRKLYRTNDLAPHAGSCRCVKE